jgi:hypothetical protein
MKTKEKNIGEILIKNNEKYPARITETNIKNKEIYGDIFYSCDKFFEKQNGEPIKINDEHSMVINKEKHQNDGKELIYFCIYDQTKEKSSDIVKIYENTVLFSNGYFETRNKKKQLKMLTGSILPFMGVHFQKKPEKK